jgi:hypothetical protein
MFTALANIFKQKPEFEIDLSEANRALHERTIRLFRHPQPAPQREPVVLNSPYLIKNKAFRRQTFMV